MKKLSELSIADLAALKKELKEGNFLLNIPFSKAMKIPKLIQEEINRRLVEIDFNT